MERLDRLKLGLTYDDDRVICVTPNVDPIRQRLICEPTKETHGQETLSNEMSTCQWHEAICI